MGIMITYPGYNNGYNNPIHNSHKTVGAHYTQQDMVYLLVFSSLSYIYYISLSMQIHFPFLVYIYFILLFLSTETTFPFSSHRLVIHVNILK